MRGKLIRSTTNFLDVQRTADPSREIWKKYSAWKQFCLYITFLLRFFITWNICWKTDFLSSWLSNLLLTTPDIILLMTLPLVTTENSPHIYLQTEVRMIERTQFSKTLTILTSNICLCLMGVCPHQMRMWGQNIQNSRFSLRRHSGCHYCCSQSHDLRAVPDRLRLMVRHLHTTTSLVLSVNMLTLAEPLMLNHFIPSVRLK